MFTALHQLSQQGEDSVTVEIDISVTGNPLSIARFIVMAEGDGQQLAFNPSSGSFEAYDPQRFDGGSASVFSYHSFTVRAISG